MRLASAQAAGSSERVTGGLGKLKKRQSPEREPLLFDPQNLFEIKQKNLPFRALSFFSLPRPPVALSELPAAWAEESRIFNALNLSIAIATVETIAEISVVAYLPSLKKAPRRAATATSNDSLAVIDARAPFPARCPIPH